ncbi:mitochondrial 2-oxoglutarate/malate carrier protein [Drosophila erecta]|uniref:Mitochondrial 2-oxoglutarate/malate carrier protein n=1 Tax=Drosophila erecta TaxID=7220 RepID=B3NG58_DROER|nr:mitochondrial 2-oxoglutarate/malate carrier protein [Drosophila erecta]EDV50959.1 uncharacterized protein Dere_GG14166 [Drosophila erecta]
MAHSVDKKSIPGYMMYINGGLAGMLGTCIVQPLDLVKTRMQISATTGEYKSSFDCLLRVFKNEGIFALYNGLSAGLMRQATYTTARMGFYQMEIDAYRNQFNAPPTVLASMGMGIMAGAFGAMFGNPAEVALIRMMSDNRLPPEERRNYKGVVNAFVRIAKDEGVTTLWKGCMPTVGRAMIVNMVQLASYSQLKAAFSNYFSGLSLHIAAAMMSGLLTTIASMPLDMAKTRIQQQKTAEYKGTMDVLMKVAKNEGVPSLWKGFTPYLCRLGPHTVFAFIFLEQLTQAYKHFVLGDDSESNI